MRYRANDRDPADPWTVQVISWRGLFAGRAGVLLLTESDPHGVHGRLRQIGLDQRGTGEPGQLTLQIGDRQVADEERERGAAGRYGIAQLLDLAVLDAGVDQLAEQGA